MLHRNAKTKFILSKLSREICVSFSIRHGDPLAMLLYIIYVEPLLIYIEKRAAGLRLFSPPGSSSDVVQCTEGYCDDLNVITDQDSDLLLVDQAVRKFELVSGAILSRNQKCKIMGFGKWNKRINWPLKYVQSVQEVKVFGVFLMNSYAQTLKRNWDYRYKKFEQTIFSWSSRVLVSLRQRVQVINVYALSRIYYIASILPLSKTAGKKFERIMGKFIWRSSGRILRVSLEELKLPCLRGGLKLACVHKMSNSLLLTQLLRLLKNGDFKSLRSVDFWIGEVLSDIFPNLDQQLHAVNTPSYFQILAGLIADAQISDLLTSTNWENITNKVVYDHEIGNLPAPKVELDLGIPFSLAWKRLCYASLPSEDRDTVFLLIHRKLPVKERLFRINMEVDPYCTTCFDVDGDAVICDLEHFFCTCGNVLPMWNSVKEIIFDLLQVHVSNQDILSFLFPSSSFEAEIMWLLGSYVGLIWTWHYVKGDTISSAQLFGFLKFKYRKSQLGSRVTFGPRMLDNLTRQELLSVSN